MTAFRPRALRNNAPVIAFAAFTVCVFAIGLVAGLLIASP